MPEPDSYEIVDVATGDEWDDFVRLSVGSMPFATSAWLDCARAAGGDPVIHGCFRRGELVGAVSGLAVGRGRGSRLVTPPLLPHGGFLYRAVHSDTPARRESGRNSAAASLIQFLSSTYASSRLTHAPELTDIREFAWAGWDVQPRYTYRLDLGDRQRVWQGLERRTRAVIRKAEEADFLFKRLDDPQLLRRQYELVYSDRPPVEAALVERLVAAAQEAGLTEMYVVEAANGQAASAVVFARGSDCVYAWVAGADPAFRDSGATSLLYWKFLEQTSFGHFDFVGANIPGIALFKRGFGGELVTYYHTEGYRRRWRRSLAAIRRIWRPA